MKKLKPDRAMAVSPYCASKMDLGTCGDCTARSAND